MTDMVKLAFALDALRQLKVRFDALPDSVCQADGEDGSCGICEICVTARAMNDADDDAYRAFFAVVKSGIRAP